MNSNDIRKNQNDIRHEELMDMLDIEYYPELNEDTDLKKYTQIPLSEIAALGGTFLALSSVIESVGAASTGNSGLYRVVFPPGVVGKLANAPDFGQLGTIMNNNKIVGQARWVEATGGAETAGALAIDPVILVLAIALYTITYRLDEIKSVEEDILSFLEQKNESELKGNLNVLADVMNNYKYNWNNATYRNNKHALVQEIKREAEQNIIFYKQRANDAIKEKKLLHTNTSTDKKFQKLSSDMKYYQLSLYLFSFASFLEVILLESYDSDYLKGISGRIEEYSYDYRELYTDCYNYLEQFAKTSVETQVMKGAKSISKIAGDGIAKIPVVSKLPVDESLISASDILDKFKYKKADDTMRLFVQSKDNGVQVFSDNIKKISRLYNQPVEIMIDKENVYYIA